MTCARATIPLLVVGVGGVGVSTKDVLDLVHQTLLVSAGALQVVVVDSRGGGLSAGKTGSVIVLVGRVGSVTLGKVVTVSGQAGQLVVVGSLVTDRVTVVGTGTGDLVSVGDVVVSVPSGSVKPVGTGGSTRDGTVRVATLELGDALVADGSGPLVKVTGGGVGTVDGRVRGSSDTSAGVASGQTGTSVRTLADSLVVVAVVLLVTSDGILDLVGHLSVVLGDVSAGTERASAGLLWGEGQEHAR